MATEQTEHLYECQTHVQQIGRGVSMWTHDDIGFMIYSWPKKFFSESEFADVVGDCLADINEVCDVNCYLQSDPNKANVIITAQMIDGPGGVLADQQLPPVIDPRRPIDTSKYRVIQRIDLGETWVRTAERKQAKIDIEAVHKHENGHAMGLDHHPGVGDLMDARYSSERDYGDWSRAQLVMRYGEKPQGPTPGPGIPDTPVQPTPAPWPDVVTKQDLIRAHEAYIRALRNQ